MDTLITRLERVAEAIEAAPPISSGEIRNVVSILREQARNVTEGYRFLAYGNANGNTADAEKIVSIAIESTGQSLPVGAYRAAEEASVAIFEAMYGQKPRRTYYYRDSAIPSEMDDYALRSHGRRS